MTEILTVSEVQTRDSERRERARQALEPLIREYINTNLTPQGLEFSEKVFCDPLFTDPSIQNLVIYGMVALDEILSAMQDELKSKGWCYRKWYTNTPPTIQNAIITLEKAAEQDATAKQDFLERYEGQSIDRFRDHPTSWAYGSRSGVSYYWKDIKEWINDEQRANPPVPKPVGRRPLLCRLARICREVD